jgi:hypothetical protein
LTVIAEVADEPSLLAALASFPRATFAEPTLGIHFARMLLVPRDPQGAPSAAWLALETNFDARAADDGSAQRAQLGALASSAGGAFAEVLRHCKGFDGGAGNVEGYLASHLVPPTAAYQGHPYHDVARIKLEQRLRDVVIAWLETAPRDPPMTLFDSVRGHVRAQSKVDPALAGLDVDAPAPPLPDPRVRSEHLREMIWPWIQNVGPALPIIPHLPAIAWWDAHDESYDVRTHQEAWTEQDLADFASISASEDHGLQNALSHVVPLRAGAGRRAVLESAHTVIAAVAKNHFAYVGQLGGIPTIHFAKWLLIDSGTRLLFFSNYDGSWESYLGDFIDQAAEGLNVAWSCTREYPKTHLLAFDGAKDEETFKSWGRDCQMPTQIFYSAYPDLSIQAVNNNTLIRYRLHEPAGAGDLDTWFRRLT